MPSKQREIPFPLKGIDEGWAYGRQPDGTTPDARNVRPFDPLQNRLRGGQRAGLNKYMASALNGSNTIQAMEQVTSQTASSGFSETFTGTDDVKFADDDTDYYHYRAMTPGDLWNAVMTGATADTVQPIYKSNTLQFMTDAEIYASHHISKTAVPTGDLYVSFDTTWVSDPAGSIAGFGVTLRGDRSAKDAYYIGFMIAGYSSTMWLVSLFKRDNAVNTDLNGGNAALLMAFVDPSGNYFLPSQRAWSDTVKIEIWTHSNDIFIYANGVLVTSFIGEFTDYTDHTEVGFVCDYTPTGDALRIDNFTARSATEAAAATRTSRILAVSGGSVYDGDQTNDKALVTGGGAAMATTGRIGLQSLYGKTYLCDGVASHYKIYTGSTRALTTWTPTAGALPIGTTDSTKAAKIVVAYRGRLVLTGLEEEPNNWFMSAVGDPLDFDYGATTSATMAVAGNNTDAGLCADIITCLAPYSDDLMIMGGDHTLWIMRGDPADRGRIDNLSYRTGIAGPDAAAFDPNGILFFFGNGALWRLVPGSVPESISQGRMDKTFAAIDISTYDIKLMWDSVRQGLHMFVVPATSGATVHYYWDARTDGFWSTTYPNDCGPFSTMYFNSDDPNDEAILLGGFDSYIRKIDDAATNDDGTAISSYVFYPPIAVGGPMRNTRLSQITTILDTNSDDVTLTAYAEDTVQKVINSSTIRWARTLAAGRTKILNRVAGNAISLKLSNSVDSTTWAIENLVADIEVIGHTRKNQI